MITLKNRRLALTVTAILMTVVPKVVFADTYDLGLSLAIEYFGAEKGTPKDLIGYGSNPSPEYRFMSGLAWALADKAPDLVRILSPESCVAYTPLQDPHLALSGSYSTDSAKQAIEALVMGCPYSEDISQSVSQSDTPPTVTARTRTYFLRTDSTDPKDLVCMNTAAQKLMSLGFSEIQVSAESGASTATSLILGGAGQPRNMMPVREQLLSIRGLTDLAQTLTPVNGTGGIPSPKDGGPGTFQFSGDLSTHVIGSSISFTYKYGWGDCESGCINSHTWNVVATPHAGTDGSYTFDLSIQESGRAIGT
jgi:hypothetical protein